jgi:hypothetical protein
MVVRGNKSFINMLVFIDLKLRYKQFAAQLKLS